MEPLEVIGAFVDRERVDPEALKDALSTEEGRAYLVDLVALREMTVLQAPAMPVVTEKRQRMSWLAMAAAMLLAVGGGYAAGQVRARSAAMNDAVVLNHTPLSTPSIPAPPAPTTVIQLQPGIVLQEVTGG